MIRITWGAILPLLVADGIGAWQSRGGEPAGEGLGSKDDRKHAH